MSPFCPCECCGVFSRRRSFCCWLFRSGCAMDWLFVTRLPQTPAFGALPIRYDGAGMPLHEDFGVSRKPIPTNGRKPSSFRLHHSVRTCAVLTYRSIPLKEDKKICLCSVVLRGDQARWRHLPGDQFQTAEIGFLPVQDGHLQREDSIHVLQSV